MAITLTIKNNGGSPVTIGDIGITIAATSQETYTELQDIRQLLESPDLYALATSGVLVLNDGASDIPIAEIDDFIQLHNTGDPSISGTGSPNGIITGFFGQRYLDTAYNEWWICLSNPYGTSWGQQAKADQANTVQTTDATQTTCGQWTVPDNQMIVASIMTLAYKSDKSDYAVFWRTAVVVRSGGAPSIVGPIDTQFSRSSAGASSWKATMDVSGNDFRVRVTGQTATTINWKSWARFHLMDFI